MRNIMHILSLAFAISACSAINEKLGVVTAGPDEYAISRNKKLVVPEKFDLTEPVIFKTEPPKKKLDIRKELIESYKKGKIKSQAKPGQGFLNKLRNKK